MSVVDTAWLRMDSPDNLMVINGVMLFEEPFKRERFSRLIEQRFLLIDKFRCAPVKAGWRHYWEAVAELDMNYHVTALELEASGDPERGLQKAASRLSSEPFDPDKPLWRFYLVENYKGGSAVIFRVHHAYADGVALVSVLDSIADVSVIHTSPAANFRLPERKPAFDGVLGQMLFALSSTLFYLGFGIGWLYEALKVLLLPADSPTVYKQSLQGNKQVAWAPSIPLEEVKAVGAKLGCTVNDVLLGCVSGSLREHLQQNGEPVDRISLRAMVPVNLRPLSEAMNLGNRFGLVYLDLPVNQEDSVARVRAVRRNMAKLKNGLQARMSYSILGMLGFFPASVQRVALSFFSTKASAVMTNVPGPAQAVNLDGVRLGKPMFWVPQSGGIGLGISILSFAGRVEFGVMADTGLVENPEQIIEGFVKEFSHLQQIVARQPGEVVMPTLKAVS